MERREAPGASGLTRPGGPRRGSAQRRCGGAFAPSDVGGRRLPALHRDASRRDHVLPVPGNVAPELDHTP